MKTNLEILKEARTILDERYIAHYRHFNGGVCALGALEESSGINNFIEHHMPQLVSLVATSAARLYPKLAETCSYAFHSSALTVAVTNNNLGKEAILAAFDDAIANEEVHLLCEAEEKKLSCPTGQPEQAPEVVAAV